MTQQPALHENDPRAGRPAPSTWRLTTVLGTTGAFGLAGYLASLVVPVGYTAALDMSASDTPAARQALVSASAGEPLSILAPTGAQVRLSSTAPSVSSATAVVEEAAARIEARLAAIALSATQEAASTAASRGTADQAAPTEEPRAVSPTARRDAATAPAAVEALMASAKEARDEAALLQAQIDALATVEDPVPDRLTSAFAAQASARADFANLERLRSAVSSSRSPEALTAVRPPPEGWAEWVRLSEDRARLREQVAKLSRTLLDGHPRMAMARLRLADLDEQVRAKRETVLRSLDDRLRNARTRVATADAEVESLRTQVDLRERSLQRQRDLEQRRDVARRLADRLEASAQASETAADMAVSPDVPRAAPVPPQTQPTPPVAESAPSSAFEITRTWLPPQPERADPLPVIAASALFGLLVSTLGMVVLGGRTRHRVVSDATVPAVEPLPVSATRSNSTPPEFDITPIDDVIDAAISSNVTRIMLTGDEPSNGARPLAVNIARRLSLRGQAVALVDLSTSQAAARTMGVSTTAPTIADLIEGRATFAAVAARDFATQAEIVPGGATTDLSPVSTPVERRNVLDFVEKSYEAIIVDCTEMVPEQLASLMDTDAALLVAVDASQSERTRQRIDGLRKAGLADMILVSETRAA